MDVGNLNTCTFRLLSSIGPGLKQVNPFFFPVSLLLLRLLRVVSLSALSLPLRQVCACVEASSVKALRRRGPHACPDAPSTCPLHHCCACVRCCNLLARTTTSGHATRPHLGCVLVAAQLDYKFGFVCLGQGQTKLEHKTPMQHFNAIVFLMSL